MKIRFLVSVAGEFCYAPGEIADFPEELARKWADGVRAEFVAEEVPELEAANLGAAEESTALATPEPRKRGRPRKSE